MGCRTAVGLVLGMVVTSGCLLTSNFEGIADGVASSSGAASGSSSSGSSDAASAFAYGPFVASSCTAHSICLTFDDADAGDLPAGWSPAVSSTASLGRSAAASVSAPYALAAQLAPSAGGEGSAFLVRALDPSPTPLGTLSWGFAALLTDCAGTAGAATPGSITLAGLGPTEDAAAGIVLGVTADYLSLVTAGESKLVALPQRLPRGAWFRADLQLASAGATTLSLRVNDAPITALEGAALGAVTAPVLDVGVLATYPASGCTAVLDDYYFDGT